MSLFRQGLLDVHDELIVDLFAGGGGASSGIEQATGRMVDVAINHNAAAVSMHAVNHPQTKHFVSDMFEVDPRAVANDRPIGLLWASPDCTFHSKARGGKPIRHATKKRRALAWVVTRWAAQVMPRVIMLENVEEFANWGPLVGPPEALRPCPRNKGRTFRRWVRTLRQLGYAVEWRELRACDYGAPTIRKRLFVIARCDGKPIVWPDASHGPGTKLKYRTAAECIDWSIPMCSIFATKDEARAWAIEHGKSCPQRPLAENTMRRTARGVRRHVLDNPKPFIVKIAHGDGVGRSSRWGDGSRSTDEPLTTVTAKGEDALVAPCLVPRYGERDGQAPRCRSIEDPMPTVVNDGNGASLVAAEVMTYYGDKHELDARGQALGEPLHTIPCENRHALVASFMTQNNGGYFEENDGRSITDPMSTILANSRGHHGLVAAHLCTNNNSRSPDYSADGPAHTVVADGAAHNLVAAHIQRDFGTSTGHRADEPLGTITSEGGGKAGLVASFLAKYYGTGTGQAIDEPAHTIPTKDRLGLVTVMIKGTPHVIVDIAMRMLQPRELYRAQGFRDSYIIDRGADGRVITKTEQVHMCGNSVSPVLSEALVTANLPELAVRNYRRSA